MGSHSVALRLEVRVGSKMAAVKTICKFLLYSMLISAVFCDSTEDFLSNYEEAEDEHNSQIASDNPTYSETSTHSGNSEPYLDVDVMTDEELQEAVTEQSLDDPENLNEVTSTKSPDIKSLNNESEKKETIEAFENKHDLSPHEKMKRSSDDVDKIPETTTINGDDVIEYTDGGVACKSKCEKNGQEYFWCWQITGSWDYCIPAVVPTISTTTETTTTTTTKKPTTYETTTTESSTTTTEFLTTTTKPTTTTMKSTTTTTEPIITTTEPSTITTEPTTTTTEPTTTTTESTTTTTESTTTTLEPTTTTLEPTTTETLTTKT